MQPAVLVRLRPAGPWRFGPGTGGGIGVRELSDSLFRSDRLFAAVTVAARQLGFLEEWLDATARAGDKPAVRFSSLYPFQGDTLFITPPATLWPPPPSRVATPNPAFLAKLRWEHARFVPVSLVQTLLLGQNVLAEQWTLDTESGCLLRRDRPASTPFRRTLRRRVPVDRITGHSDAARPFACIDFEPSAGLWTALQFRNTGAAQDWEGRMRAAFRLLGDTGFGGGRSCGWGQCHEPEWQAGAWPQVLFPRLEDAAVNGGKRKFWLLSLFSPSPDDRISWDEGLYRLTARGRSGSTLTVKLVEEGSVISAVAEPVGRAVDLSGPDEPHPHLRAGFALVVTLPEPAAGASDAAEAESSSSTLESAPPTEEHQQTEKALGSSTTALPDDPVPTPDPKSETAAEDGVAETYEI